MVSWALSWVWSRLAASVYVLGAGVRYRGDFEARSAPDVLPDEWLGLAPSARTLEGGSHPAGGAGLQDPGSVDSGCDLTRDGGGGGRGRGR